MFMKSEAGCSWVSFVALEAVRICTSVVRRQKRSGLPWCLDTWLSFSRKQHLKHFQESGLDSGGLWTCLQTRLSENLEGFLVENKYGRGSAA